jgi:hypothetical protein
MTLTREEAGAGKVLDVAELDGLVGEDLWLVGLASVAERLRLELGKDGVLFFREVYEKHGALNVCLETDDSVPHPVYFREGMKVRNILRELTGNAFDDHWYDGMWIPITMLAITKWEDEWVPGVLGGTAP